MSLRACQVYTKNLLQQQVIGEWKPLDVYAELPTTDKAGLVPKVFVWPLEGVKRRQAGSRGAGRKEAIHTLNIALIVAMKAPKIDTEPSFLDLVEGLMALLEQSSLSATATDPVSGVESAVAFLGEEMDYYCDAPVLIKPQSLSIFKAVVTAKLTEFYAG